VPLVEGGKETHLLYHILTKGSQMSEVSVGAAIVGIVQGVKSLVPQVNGIVTVILAAVLGLLAGFAGMGGLNWLTGLAIGLAAVGTTTLASKIGATK